MTLKVLGIIPARGGSKGVPRKNIKVLGDKPLISYTIEIAKAAPSISTLIVSTDDNEIAKVARKYGAEIPFLRPEELSTDTTPMVSVLKHVISFYAQKEEIFDAICLLQPTTPFRTVEDIENCVDIMTKTNADTVITTVRVPDVFNPYWVYTQKGETLSLSVAGETKPRRQDLPLAFGRAGSVYLMKPDNVMKNNSLYGNKIMGYEIPHERNINIDTLSDWEKAECFLKRNNDGS